MEGSLGDRHDETVYYVSSHWDELAVKNVLKLQKLTVFFAVVYFLYLVLAYVIVKTFNLRLSCFSVPLYILFFWKIADILRRRPDMKAWLSRVVVFAFFAGLSYIVSYIDAARVDGAGEIRIFNRIVGPMMRPAIAVQAIFSFVASWNNYFLAALVMQSKRRMTLPVIIAMMRNADFVNMDMGRVYMMLCVAVFPVIIVYLLLSRQILDDAMQRMNWN